VSNISVTIFVGGRQALIVGRRNVGVDERVGKGERLVEGVERHANQIDNAQVPNEHHIVHDGACQPPRAGDLGKKSIFREGEHKRKFSNTKKSTKSMENKNIGFDIVGVHPF